MKKVTVFLACIVFCLFHSRGQAEAYSEVNKEWQVCQSDEECTAGIVCCECWEPINKQYIKKIVTLFNNCSGDCDGSCRPQNQPVTSCIDNRCTAMYEKRTNKTMDQWKNENIVAIDQDIK